MRHISDGVKASLTQASLTDAGAAHGSALLGAFRAQLADPDFNVFYDAPGTAGLPRSCIGAAIDTLDTAAKADIGIPADVTAVVPVVVGVPAAAPPAPLRNVPQVLAWR